LKNEELLYKENNNIDTVAFEYSAPAFFDTALSENALQRMARAAQKLTPPLFLGKS
jgi:hypothetical protein